MIQSILAMASGVAVQCGISLPRVCKAMGVPHTNVRRWMKRLRDGETLVSLPGPPVFTSQDMSDALISDVKELKHNKHRSYGSAGVHARYRGRISRRNIDNVIKNERDRVVSETKKHQFNVKWHASDVVWAIDDTEFTRNNLNGKITFHQIRDLASRYIFPPMESKNIPDGAAVADNLEMLFKKHGAPLFLKRDNAGNFNNIFVDAVLAKFGVLPLNSPPAYPQYNGAEERGQAELKNTLKNMLDGVDGWSLDTIAPFVQNAAHELNHYNRPCLKNQTACHTRATTKVSFTLNQRKIIYQLVMDKRNSILLENGEKVSPAAAWRKAAVMWLSENGMLSITVAKNVLPCFKDEICPLS